MNFSPIGILIRLRYKLLWAKVRSRNSKVALFFAGYLLLVMAMALVSVSGLGAGMHAIRSGKGALVGGIALAGIYMQALLASLILGFGLSAIFSETELRRFPLKSRERRMVRHLIGIADPFWYIFLALDFGVALGLYLFGVGSPGFGLAAILALFVSNYLCARVLGILVDRLMAKAAGSAVLILLAMGCALPPAMLLQGRQNPAVVGPLKLAWSLLPPAGAAAAITQTDLAALSGLAVVFVWVIVLSAVLVVLERRPARLPVAKAAGISWVSPIDRFGALFGPRHGPLVALWLRFFSRNNRFRAIYPIALPVFAFLVFLFGRMEAKNPFALSIAAFSTLGTITTGQFAVNQFGYLGNGFRRYLLLPIESAAAFRAGSYLFVALGAILIPLGAAIWCLLSAVPFDARALVMLVGCSVTSLFLFHSIAIWTSVLGASRGNFYQSFGNDLSFAGNATLAGASLVMALAPTLLARFRPGMVSPQHWLALPPIAMAAALIYFASLNSATAAFWTRREQLMVLLEGTATL